MFATETYSFRSKLLGILLWCATIGLFWLISIARDVVARLTATLQISGAVWVCGLITVATLVVCVVCRNEDEVLPTPLNA